MNTGRQCNAFKIHLVNYSVNYVALCYTPDTAPLRIYEVKTKQRHHNGALKCCSMINV